MSLHPMNQTNLANYIPTLWSKEVQAAVEKNLVFGGLVDRRYEKYASYGNKIVVPVLSNLSATAFNAKTDINFSTTNESCVNIDLDQRYYVAYGVDDYTEVQDMIGYLDAAKEKAGYAAAKQIDDTLAARVNSFSQAVGTEGATLTSDQLISAVEYLNLADAPESQRAWIFDPESIGDLYKIDYFVRMDYTDTGIHKTGFQGRQIFGAPVYMTTNLEEVNSTYHAATYLHKDALALVMQMTPKAFMKYHLPRLSDVVVVETLFGSQEMRDTFGVWIKTRS